MIVHFVCRGNAFRSIIAEAYLNSLGIKGVTAMSSGTVASSHKDGNLANHDKTLELLAGHGIREFAKTGYGDQLTQARLDEADVTVCLNRRIYDDCRETITFSSAIPLVWSVADIGEPGRIPAGAGDTRRYREEAYQEITRNVDRLLALTPGEIRPRP